MPHIQRMIDWYVVYDESYVYKEEKKKKRGKKDQLRGIKERSTEPGRMAPSSLEPALARKEEDVYILGL